MNGFKFIDLKCLAMMVLIIVAFCGDAGQYLLMAVALVWLIAKVLEWHCSREKYRLHKKGKNWQNRFLLLRFSWLRQTVWQLRLNRHQNRLRQSLSQSTQKQMWSCSTISISGSPKSYKVPSPLPYGGGKRKSRWSRR